MLFQQYKKNVAKISLADPDLTFEKKSDPDTTFEK